MANASKDGNAASTLIAALNSDGQTVVRVKASPTTHALEMMDGTTGSDNGPSVALHDGNSVTSLLAVSSADGKTPVVVYADSSGNLLVNSH